MKRAERLVFEDGGFGGSGLGASGVRIQMNEGIESWLEGFDAVKMSIDNFYGRNFLGADAYGDFRDRGEGRNVAHKRECESIRAGDAGQARSDVRGRCEMGRR